MVWFYNSLIVTVHALWSTLYIEPAAVVLIWNIEAQGENRRMSLALKVKR
jgi:hypothetical protein